MLPDVPVEAGTLVSTMYPAKNQCSNWLCHCILIQVGHSLHLESSESLGIRLGGPTFQWGIQSSD